MNAPEEDEDRHTWFMNALRVYDQRMTPPVNYETYKMQAGLAKIVRELSDLISPQYSLESFKM